MTNNNLSLSTAGSLLLGAGIAKLDDVQIGLLLIGVGAFLKLIVAILERKGITVSAHQ